jgi:hypothetical protein
MSDADVQTADTVNGPAKGPKPGSAGAMRAQVSPGLGRALDFPYTSAGLAVNEGCCEEAQQR